MHPANVSGILVENTTLESTCLQRQVKTDFFLPRNLSDPGQASILLINDGQNMTELGLVAILDELSSTGKIRPLICIAIHAHENRKMEYGIAAQPDFKGRGGKANLYTAFVMKELMPSLQKRFSFSEIKNAGFAGFSLGGLSALDIVWNNSSVFNRVGVFSGSLWWRSIDQYDVAYSDHKHRIMHDQVRRDSYRPRLKFFFQCGNMDETRDRNGNGIIDSIDDTIDLVHELKEKGYSSAKDIRYVELKDGHHDIATWRRAMPGFLEWGWGDG